MHSEELTVVLKFINANLRATHNGRLDPLRYPAFLPAVGLIQKTTTKLFKKAKKTNFEFIFVTIET